MGGIFGHVGRPKMEPILIEGLRCLEPCGYDSGDLATLYDAHLFLRKRAGRVAELVWHIEEYPALGNPGTSDRYLSTNEFKGHQLAGNDGLVVVVHQSVIEKYVQLKRQLAAEGIAFPSDTDSEAIAQIISHHFNGDPMLRSQVTALAILSLHLGRPRHLTGKPGNTIIRQLRVMPNVIRRALNDDENHSIAERYYRLNNCFYLGRQYLNPLAGEDDLKQTEISCIPTDRMPSAEPKYDPCNHMDEDIPSVFLIPRGAIFEKVMTQLEELQACSSPVIAIVRGHEVEVAERPDDMILMPEIADYLQPLVAVVPLQLLAYHIAVFRRSEPEKSIARAKSVTVE